MNLANLNRLKNSCCTNARYIYKVNRRIFTFVNEKENIVLTDDGSTIVCWHPENPFPYECSKPLPEAAPVQNTVLKVQNMADVYSIFKDKKEDILRQELMKLTFTTKHRWYKRQRDKKRRIIEPDRPYL